MLVLSRKEGERVIIGRDIVITVLKTSSGHVKLGFNCPVEIPIHREEVWQRMAGEFGPDFAPAEAACESP